MVIAAEDVETAGEKKLFEGPRIGGALLREAAGKSAGAARGEDPPAW